MTKLARRFKQQLARRLRQEHGLEMTPDECEATLASAYSLIRKGMAAKGVTLPDDDDELRALINRATTETE